MITTKLASSDIASLQSAAFYVVDKQEQIVEESAPPPFTTATMLQDAIKQYGWSSAQTMHAAQWLFENGLITYPRTDSISIAPEAADEARKMVVLLFGNESLDSGKRWDRVQAHSEGAHEAIRPTSAARLPHQVVGEIGEDSRKLYNMIWKRFIAWYMIPAQYRVITVELERDESQSQRT